MAGTPQPHLSLRLRVGLWLLAAMLVLKVAVPQLASLAAQSQGSTVAQVCSVYGIRTSVADAAADDGRDAPTSGQHTDDSHCPLVSLLASAALNAPLPAVVLHAPRRAIVEAPAVNDAQPADASRRWLARQLHAPPVSV